MKRGKTQYLHPLEPVLDNEKEVLERQRARGRQRGAEKRHQDAQLPAVIKAEIDRCCRIDPRVKHTEIMERLKKNPATKSLLAASKLKPASLIKKIGRYRRQK